MSNPKLETYKNKATNIVYDLTDAAAQTAISEIRNSNKIDSFSDVVSELGYKQWETDFSGQFDVMGSTDMQGHTTYSVSLYTDEDPTENSTKPVESGGVYDALTAKVSWADGSKSVQKNLDNPFNKETNNANYSKTDTGYRVYMSAAATYAQLKLWYNNLPKNTDIKITSLIDYTAGAAQIAVSGTNDTWANRQAIANTSSYTADASAELTFNTGNYNYIIISLLATLGTSAQGDITFDNYMLRRDSIADGTYEPYIPNNTELFPRSEQAVLGAVNVFKPITQTVSNASQFIVDSDEYISHPANDYTDTRQWAYANSNIYMTLPKGTWKVSAFQKTAYTTGGQGFAIMKSDNTKLVDLASSATGFISLVQTPVEFTLSEDTNIGIEYKLGDGAYAIMITPSTTPTDKHIPYAMTNKELTKKVAVLKSDGFGTNISAGSDLNNYLTAGTYNCQSGTTASGLSNCPTTDAFVMDIIDMNMAGTAKLQVIHTLTKIFKRLYVNDEFTSWYRFDGTAVS